MKICIICVEREDYAPKRLFEEGKRIGHDMYMTSWMDIIMRIDEKGIYLGDRHRSFEDFDIIIQRSPSFSLKNKKTKLIKKLGTLHKLIIEYSKRRGIAILNDRYFTSFQSFDKLSQQYFLFENGLPGLPTQYFSYLPDKNVFPMVVKSAQGSLGKSVFKVKNRRELKRMVNAANVDKNFIYQKYFPIRCDYRAIVVSGRLLGVIKRASGKNEWRTNVSLGGSATQASAGDTKEIKKVAEKTAKKMLFDYVGVDILEHKGVYRVIEVNSLAQFEGFEKVYPQINVAREIIKLLENKAKKLARNKKSEKKADHKR